MEYEQQPQPPPPPPTDLPLRDSEEIQGNVLAAFNKDHQRFLLFRFNDAQAGRAWLGELAPSIATTKQVEDWNAEFSRRRHESGGVDPEDLKALWLNVSLTASCCLRVKATAPERQSRARDSLPLGTMSRRRYRFRSRSLRSSS